MHPVHHFKIRSRRRARFVLALALLGAKASPSHASAAYTFHWTAPGDDGMSGCATRYEMRFSAAGLTAANFPQATLLSGLPSPSPAGTPESFTATGVPDGKLYFGLETLDEAGNRSALSNVVLGVAGTTAVESAAPGLSMSWPNPARRSSSFTYGLHTAARVRIEAFDAQGRHVRTVEDGRHEAGGGNVVWDLQDDTGHACPAGVYLLDCTLGGGHFV
jgi:hypothetical protein